jgi:hypothetical protein
MPLKVLVTSAKCPEGRWESENAISQKEKEKEKVINEEKEGTYC